MGCDNEFIHFNRRLDQYVVDQEALAEAYQDQEKWRSMKKYCEVACRFKNRAYGNDTSQFDEVVKRQMDHLDPEVLRHIQVELLHTYSGKKRSDIPEFDQRVMREIEEMVRTILGNGTKQLELKRIYRDAAPYLQAGVAERRNSFEKQIPSGLLKEIKDLRISPYQIRIYRLLIDSPNPLKSKLFTMDDLVEAITKAKDYYHMHHTGKIPKMMIVARPDSIALVKKHIRWYTDPNIYIEHNVPDRFKYGTITLPKRTTYRILLSTNVHRKLCPKIIPESKLFIYTDPPIM